MLLDDEAALQEGIDTLVCRARRRCLSPVVEDALFVLVNTWSAVRRQREAVEVALADAGVFERC